MCLVSFSKINDVFLFWRLKIPSFHWCTYFLKKKNTYPCNKPLMTIDQIILTDIIFFHDSISNRTRLLNISKYSSVRWTKVTKQLMNWSSSLETRSKTQTWVWKIMDFLVQVTRLTTPSSLSITKFQMKSLCYKSSSKSYNLKDTEFTTFSTCWQNKNSLWFDHSLSDLWWEPFQKWTALCNWPNWEHIFVLLDAIVWISFTRH